MIFSIMERCLPITTKAGDLRLITFNTVQMMIGYFVALCWHIGRPVRLLLPKSRQMGVTTWIFLFLFARCLFAVAKGKRYRVGIVSHDDDGGETVFTIIRTIVKNLPKELDGTFTEQYRLDNFNSTCVRWKIGPAEMQVHSMKKLDALGRGGTINALHCTEVALYAAKGVDPNKAEVAIKGALVKEEDTLPQSCVFYESTAQGHDPFFYVKCRGAMDGDPGYAMLFLGWYLEPSYSMRWETYRKNVMGNPSAKDPGPRFVPTDEEAQLRAKLNQPVPPEEVLWRYQVELTDEQLIWRRNTIAELGSAKAFRQEFPSTPEEAFEASDQNMFPPDVIAHYESLVADPIERGDLVLSNPSKLVTWLPSAFGKVKAWERPIPDEDYLVIGDVSEGIGQDFSNSYVFKKKSCEIVAKFHGMITPEDYAELLEAMAYYYNRAELVCENNVSKTSGAGGLVAAILHRNAYPALYYHRDLDQMSPPDMNKPGWNTNDKSRSLALAALAEAMRSRRFVSHDERFVSEAKTFVWVEKRKQGDPTSRGGRYEAAPGKNDDSIITAAIGCYLLKPAPQRPVSPEAVESEDPILVEIRRLAAMHDGLGGRDVTHL